MDSSFSSDERQKIHEITELYSYYMKNPIEGIPQGP